MTDEEEQERLLVAKVEEALAKEHKHLYPQMRSSSVDGLTDACLYCGITRQEAATETYRQLMAKRWEKR